MPNQSETIRGGVNVTPPDATAEPKKPRGRPPKEPTTEPEKPPAAEPPAAPTE